MSSLSVHLRITEDHSSLPFHPSCPVCRRDRLSGSLSGDELVSRRTQAAVAAGLLAFSGLGAPAASLAQAPDHEVEGSSEVVDGGDSGSLDLGEGSTPLPDVEPLVADDAASDEDLLIEQAVAEVVEEPVYEAVEEAVAPAPEPASSPEPVAVVAPPVEEPAATGAPEEAASVELVVDRGSRRTATVRRAKEPQAPVAAPVVVAPVATATVETVAPANVRVVAGAGSGRAAAGDRFHVVQRGESLWSIAADVLGERAGVARVAREVNRLWALNEDRIASGSPDLLYAGTRLRLR